MDLEKEEFGPFMKQNDVPVYVDAGSNHPPQVLENIPKGINKRLSTISASKDIFDRAAPVYQAALEKSGHKFKLTFNQANPKVMKTKSKQETGKGPSFGLTPLL